MQFLPPLPTQLQSLLCFPNCMCLSLHFVPLPALVGALVGGLVAILVGASVGALIGALVGTLVGAPVRASVGASVGAPLLSENGSPFTVYFNGARGASNARMASNS